MILASESYSMMDRLEGSEVQRPELARPLLSPCATCACAGLRAQSSSLCSSCSPSFSSPAGAGRHSTPVLGVARESGTVHPRSPISILACIAQTPKGGLACIAMHLHASPKRPSAQVGRDILPRERGNRELSAKPRWLSIPPLYPVHVYRLAETYTTDQLLAKRVSSKHGSAFKASGLW